ncbi:MAG TPA: DUF4240 domain-containing protein [Croceibacterium sp.]
MRKDRLIAMGGAILVAVVGGIVPSVGARAADADPVAAMSDEEQTDRFWKIIERTRSPDGDQERQMAALAAELSAMPPDEIEAFGAVFDRLLIESYSWDLWGAAHVIMGGASDDSFDYFRVWLISRGRSVFEAARANPDELAALIPAGFDEAAEFELLAYVAADAWAEKTGDDPTNMPRPAYPTYPDEPMGEPFDESSGDLAERYPRLWARFSEAPLG